jgi:hypothetical protein
MVADDEVVGLVRATNVREHGCRDLILGERVYRESSRYGDEGLGVKLSCEAEWRGGRGPPSAAWDAGEMCRGMGRGVVAEHPNTFRGLMSGNCFFRLRRFLVMVESSMAATVEGADRVGEDVGVSSSSMGSAGSPVASSSSMGSVALEAYAASAS